MLPYTTYRIPETDKNQTETSDKWLWMIIRKPLTEADTELLLKISSALKADFSLDVRFIQQPPNEEISLASQSPTKPKLIISFGVLPSELGLWIDLHRPGMSFLESCIFILTLPVEELSKHAAAKKELWQSMQIFLEQ
ncbi:MAG TPA: hypothetical protein PLV75_03385 [Saprospiraceae bacterium]|jgi:hypothetical protein|nr:hypothetical protein [Saprospiraceae bacterium]HQW24969.1 hypothetical protein [Saprospiraceae bacterium]